MRNATRQRLIDRVAAVSGRVYQPHMGGPTVEKPYLVVKMGGESKSTMKNGYDLPVQVWAYIERTSEADLDTLCSTVVNVLNRKDIVTTGGQTFSLEYQGWSDDFYDEDWDALARRIDFSTARVREG